MKKYDQTVKELKEDIKELESYYTKKAKEIAKDKKTQVRELVDNAEKTINNSIEKVGKVIKELKEDEKLDDLLDTIKAKSKEAVDYTIEKIETIANGEDDEVSIDKIYDDIMNEFNKLKGSDTFKKTTILIKQGAEKINEFLERPEVKQKINKAKKTTIKVAEKGVEELKKVLEVKEEAPKTKKTTKAKITKKKTTKKAKTTAK